VASDLGSLIAAEVTRAEADFQAFRTRALGIVSVAGGLVTLVAGFLSIAAGTNKDILPTEARCTVLLALLSYVAATVLALVINVPASVRFARPQNLESFARENWDNEGWDQQAAIVLATYLTSLREANERAAKWLTGAIACEIGGIFFTAVMALLVIGSLR